MKVSKHAAVWLRRRLPKGFEPVDVIPRAYCSAKPATLCAVFSTPPDDYRPHLTKSDVIRECNAGQTIRDGVRSVRVGDWGTICYAIGEHQSGWFYAGGLIPFRMLRTTGNDGAGHP